MTTPIEVEINLGTMYFYLSNHFYNTGLRSADNVILHQVPKSLLASYGVRGSYNEKNFNLAPIALKQWLSNNKVNKASGNVHAIF